MLGQKDQYILDWLSPVNSAAKQNEFFDIRREGTGNWILKEQLFKNWLYGYRNILWCHGPRKSPLLFRILFWMMLIGAAGVGKTIIAYEHYRPD